MCDIFSVCVCVCVCFAVSLIMLIRSSQDHNNRPQLLGLCVGGGGGGMEVCMSPVYFGRIHLHTVVLLCDLFFPQQLPFHRI